jgi:hypothetical protein
MSACDLGHVKHLMRFCLARPRQGSFIDPSWLADTLRGLYQGSFFLEAFHDRAEKSRRSRLKAKISPFS